ncbi:uncharacterized protein LOC106510154 [Sus scrofa]|uniref:uncharacterized protein LOC106510154 n=1 Tax=Sus scrofa TaxID=9823 RepID=UPI0006B1AAB2|nr:uncharacterized protein LOC106510154 [Sus scrofa]
MRSSCPSWAAPPAPCRAAWPYKRSDRRPSPTLFQTPVLDLLWSLWFRESQERCLTSSSSASSPASHLLCAYPSALSHVHPLSALSHVHLLAHLWCAQFQYASRNAHPAHRAHRAHPASRSVHPSACKSSRLPQDHATTGSRLLLVPGLPRPPFGHGDRLHPSQPPSWIHS